MARKLEKEEFSKLKLNASGFILEKQEIINIKTRLEQICNKVYDSKYYNFYYEEDEFVIRTYRIKKKVSWGTFDNIFHHYVFIYQPNESKYIFVGFSEQQKMKKVKLALNKDCISSEKLNQIDSEILKKSFLSDEIHTMWMNNQTRKTLYKPNNKVLMGSVDNILNPVMDSSFSFSSARGRIENKKIIISPSNSKFFLKKSSDINNLKSLLSEVSKHIDNNKNSIFKHNYLLAPMENKKFENFGKLEDFILQSPDWLDSLDIFTELTELTKEEYEIIYDTLTINILEKKSADSKHTYFASIEVSYENIKFKANFYQQNRIYYSELTDIKGEIAFTLKEIFLRPEFMKFYFSCGHIIDGTDVYKNQYNNIDYENKRIKDIEFTELFDIKKEKPVKKNAKNNNVFDKEQIGKSDSLFCWAIKNWKQEIIEDKKNQIKKEYMICDDGSNEIADFIHLVELKNNKYILNFIHIKASKTDSGKQQISVGAFDLVLTQAIKNARYTNIEQLKEQLSSSSKNIDALWEDNKLSKKKRDFFIKKIEEIHKKNYFYEANIIVVQPHLRKENYEKTKNTNNKKLLNTLFHSANSAISGFSSSLYIICSK